MKYIYLAIAIIISYFYGSINNAVIISKIMKRDIRSLGSGNPGAMNMLRCFGKRVGVLTLILDALKGAVPAIVGWIILNDWTFGDVETGLYLCAFATIMGHLFPLFYEFRGGKGVASMIGVCFVISPIITACSFVLGVLYIIFFKWGFIGSFIIIGIPCIANAVMEFIAGNIFEGIACIVLFLIVVYKHKENIKRFAEGRENKTVLFGKNRAIAKKTDEKIEK